MKKREISSDLQQKVKKYYEYLHDEQIENSEKGQMMINNLEGQLKYEVMKEIYGKILMEKQIFKTNFSQEFVDSISQSMKEIKIGPGQTIIEENQLVEKVFFILSGQVDLTVNIRSNAEKSTNRQFITLCKLKAGDIIGQFNFFSQQRSHFSAVSQNVVTLAYFELSEFLATLAKFSSDYQKYCMLKDNLNIYHFQKGLGIKCECCARFTHISTGCP